MDAVKPRGLVQFGVGTDPAFTTPAKLIDNEEDVKFFLTSNAYTDIVTFILQLNASLFPRRQDDRSASIQTWELESSNVPMLPAAKSLSELVLALNQFIDEAPPNPGPRRFGNVAFRKWYSIVENHIDALLTKHLSVTEDDVLRGAQQELKAYLLGSFGSAQRLDYGTGHELSFLAFLAGLWKLRVLGDSNSEDDDTQERAIVLHVFEPYLKLIRRLILTYTLEPAGSHGVWGLDDHSFLPYVFGSAQLGPPIINVADIPQEGSLSDAPDPGDVTKVAAVERERKRNMYFSAIGFIYDVKKGPFWEHSPMLYDISGIRQGWAKINKGMIKMYIAEVLSKFPVVQHFPFGGLFQWKHDPNAPPPPNAPHTSMAEQRSNPPPPPSFTGRPAPGTPSEAATSISGTRAPWATTSSGGSSSSISSTAPSAMPSTKAAWASASSSGSSGAIGPTPPTRAPWAKDR